MSDVAKAFFKKYNAVPATDAGPAWPAMTDAQLMAEYYEAYWIAELGQSQRFGRKTSPAERRTAARQVKAMEREILTRSETSAVGGPAASVALRVHADYLREHR